MKQGKKALSLLAVVAFLVMALVPMTALADASTATTIGTAANSAVPYGTGGDVTVTVTPDAAVANNTTINLSVKNSSNADLAGCTWAIGAGVTTASVTSAGVLTLNQGAAASTGIALTLTVPDTAAVGTYTVGGTFGGGDATSGNLTDADSGATFSVTKIGITEITTSGAAVAPGNSPTLTAALTGVLAAGGIKWEVDATSQTAGVRVAAASGGTLAANATSATATLTIPANFTGSSITVTATAAVPNDSTTNTAERTQIIRLLEAPTITLDPTSQNVSLGGTANIAGTLSAAMPAGCSLKYIIGDVSDSTDWSGAAVQILPANSAATTFEQATSALSAPTYAADTAYPYTVAIVSGTKALATAQGTINMKAAPKITAAGNVSSIEEGRSVVLTADFPTAEDGDTCAWSFTSNAAASKFTGTGAAADGSTAETTISGGKATITLEAGNAGNTSVIQARVDGQPNPDDLTLTVTAAGEPSITVVADETAVTAPATVTVTATARYLTGNELTWSLTGDLGSTAARVTISPEKITYNAATATYTATVTVPAGYTQSNDGNVTVTCSDGTTSGTATIAITAAADGITLTPTTVSGAAGSTVTLTATVLGPNASSAKTVRWALMGLPAGVDFPTPAASTVGEDGTATLNLRLPAGLTEGTKFTVRATPLDAAGAAVGSLGTADATVTVSAGGSEPTDEPTDQPTDTPTDQPTDQPTQPTATASTAPGATPSASMPASNAPTVPAPAASNPAVLPPATTASTAPSALPSASPSGSATAAPSGSAAPTPAATAPVEINESAADVPEDLEVTANPSGTGSVITGAPISTPQETNSVSQLKSWIAVPEGGSVQVLTASGAPAADDAPMATGMIVRVYDAQGQAIEESTLVVMADVMGTGEISLTQLVNMAAAYMGTRPLEGVYALAADLDGSGSITLTDLVIAARIFREAGLTMNR